MDTMNALNDQPLPPTPVPAGDTAHLKQERAIRTRGVILNAAAEAFGGDVIAHYVRAAEVELEAFGAAVTDWERVRGFERM